MVTMSHAHTDTQDGERGIHVDLKPSDSSTHSSAMCCVSSAVQFHVIQLCSKHVKDNKQ